MTFLNMKKKRTKKNKLTGFQKDLVVDEDDVRLGNQLVHARALQHVALLELDVAHDEAPHPAADLELLELLPSDLGGRGHELDAEAGAAGLETSLEDDVADAGAEVEEDGVLGESGGGDDVGDERGHELAVDGGGEGFVVAEGLDVWPDGALVGLVDDAHEDGLGDAGVGPGVHGGCEEVARGGGRGEFGVFEVAEEGVDGVDGFEEEGPVALADGALDGPEVVDGWGGRGDGGGRGAEVGGVGRVGVAGAGRGGRGRGRW